jgi:hypothetical protein
MTGGSAGGVGPYIDGNGNNERDILLGFIAFDADSNNSATTNWETWTVTQKTTGGNAQTLRVNGAARTISPNNSSINLGTGTWVGAYNRSHYLNGGIAAILEYNSVLNGTQIGQVESYLRSTYATW